MKKKHLLQLDQLFVCVSLLPWCAVSLHAQFLIFMKTACKIAGTVQTKHNSNADCSAQYAILFPHIFSCYTHCVLYSRIALMIAHGNDDAKKLPHLIIILYPLSESITQTIWWWHTHEVAIDVIACMNCCLMMIYCTYNNKWNKLVPLFSASFFFFFFFFLLYHPLCSIVRCMKRDWDRERERQEGENKWAI